MRHMRHLSFLSEREHAMYVALQKKGQLRQKKDAGEEKVNWRREKPR